MARGGCKSWPPRGRLDGGSSVDEREGVPHILDSGLVLGEIAETSIWSRSERQSSSQHLRPDAPESSPHNLYSACASPILIDGAARRGAAAGRKSSPRTRRPRPTRSIPRFSPLRPGPSSPTCLRSKSSHVRHGRQQRTAPQTTEDLVLEGKVKFFFTWKGPSCFLFRSLITLRDDLRWQRG
jgi:hypothetical protein